MQYISSLSGDDDLDATVLVHDFFPALTSRNPSCTRVNAAVGFSPGSCFFEFVKGALLGAFSKEANVQYGGY